MTTESGWVRPGTCANDACVEVKFDRTYDIVTVRASLIPQAVVDFTAQEWAEFLVAVRAGEFDMP
jgi:hypothetical protein